MPLIATLATASSAAVVHAPDALRAARPAGTSASGEAKPQRDAAIRRVAARYCDDLHAGRYDRAYAALSHDEQTYYGNASNFRSSDRADNWELGRYTFLRDVWSHDAGAVIFVREQIRRRDFEHDVDVRVETVVPLGVVREHGAWRIKDPGRAQRAFAAAASAQHGGIGISVKKIAQFPGRIDVTVGVRNGSARFVTALAYGRTRLIDAGGHRYTPLAVRDWRLTDRVLFEGLHLAPDAMYTGRMSFVTRASDARPPFALTFGPLLPDGGDEPFDLAVDGIVPAPARVVRR